MLWLALTWIALIALWGTSDRWSLRDLGRRLAHAARTAHVVHHPREQPSAVDPLD